MLNLNLKNINFNKCKKINEKLLNIKNVKKHPPLLKHPLLLP